MTISEIVHCDTNGIELWRSENLRNVFHIQGEEFFLKALFTQAIIPGSYYVGLDNRLTINKADIPSGLVGEPGGNGYSRQAVSTAGGFGATYDSGKWNVKSITLLFNATGAGWGPVRNAFLTTATGNSGKLISSVALLSPRTMTAGQTLTFRFALSLGD